jgi:energy-coupling factor transport system permease protein
MKNFALGQYYPADSFIHRLDPRTKIIMALAILVVIFLINTFIGFAVVGAFFFTEVALSKVSFNCVIRTVRPLIFIIAFTFVLNMFFYNGETVWFEWGILKCTEEGFIKALFMAIRLLLLIMSTSLMTLTTSPVQLTDGLERLAAPFSKMGAPVHEMAMMMSIALRFIPTLTDETDRIQKAQTARGAEFDTGNIFKKAKNMIPLLVPLFISAFKRADELALAMESRCYHGGEGRTKMKVLVFTKNDVWMLVICAVLCVLLAVFL